MTTTTRPMRRGRGGHRQGAAGQVARRLVGGAWLAAQVAPAAASWLYLAATLAALVPFGRRAFALGRAGTPFSIETLMVTAALGAAVIGAAEEAAFVVVLFALGELLEGVAAGQARAGIRALVALMLRTAQRGRHITGSMRRVRGTISAHGS